MAVSTLPPRRPRLLSRVAALLALAPFPTAALYAAPVPAGPAEDEALWAKLDANASGWLSGRELDGGRWLAYDADKDGEVTKAEFLAGRAAARTASSVAAANDALWKQLDQTESGYLSGKELSGGLDRYDANKDGRLTKAEFVAGRAADAAAGRAPAPASPAVPVAPAPPTASPPAAPVAPTPPAAAPPVAPAGRAPGLPPDRSDLVARAADGGLAVLGEDGAPVDGVKLSRHDWGVQSPAVAVAPDGTIHVAFLDKNKGTGNEFVYHRSSGDAGKTWTDPKNVSEALPLFHPGPCQVAVDGAGRAYVVWRTALSADSRPSFEPGAGISHIHHNLVFRVLDGGAWSKPLPVHPPGSTQTKDNGSLAWFVATDPRGRVHVCWTTSPARFHPELLTGGGSYKTLPIDVGHGLVVQATLDGATPGAPREIWMAKITDGPGKGARSSDGYETLDGYVGADGRAVFAAAVTNRAKPAPNTPIVLFDGGRQTPLCELPGDRLQVFRSAPRLLVDAKGRKHVIAAYTAGEHPGVRDYLAGGDAEPAVVRETKGLKGYFKEFQAYQGPGGRMAVLAQLSDDGGTEDTFLMTSDGGPWGPPVNVTNNAGRATFFSKPTSANSNIARSVRFQPGPGAVAWDRDGHLLLVMVVNKLTAASNSAFGVTLGGGEAKTPMLTFLRF